MEEIKFLYFDQLSSSLVMASNIRIFAHESFRNKFLTKTFSLVRIHSWLVSNSK